jgi:bacterioferritin
MGSTGKSIVGLDTKELVELLNKALADEWLAYYQYWIGAKVVKGLMSDAIEKELMEHAGEELKHAEMLVERILQLEGIPLLHPQKWLEKTNCGYLAPEKFAGKEILKQNIQGERCAIKIYEALLKKTKDKDEITNMMILDILKEEIEHEHDLQMLLEDLTL